MIGENATAIVPGILCVSGFLTWVLCRAASLKSDAEDRLARTLVLKKCLKCAHEYDFRVIPYDPDHGVRYTIETTCLACEYEAGRMVDIDLDSTSVDEIRSLGRDVSLGQVSRAGGRRSATIEGRFAHDAADSSA